MRSHFQSLQYNIVAVRDQQTHKFGYYLTELEVFPIHYNMRYIALINFC